MRGAGGLITCGLRMVKGVTVWTRNDSISLGGAAMKAGLDTHNSHEALMIGARMIAHGFKNWEIEYMIHAQYRFRSDLERGYDQGTISPTDFQRLREIRGW